MRSPEAVAGEVQEGLGAGAGTQGVVRVPEGRFWAKARGAMSQITHGLLLQAAELGLYPGTLGSCGRVLNREGHDLIYALGPHGCCMEYGWSQFLEDEFVPSIGSIPVWGCGWAQDRKYGMCLIYTSFFGLKEPQPCWAW